MIRFLFSVVFIRKIHPEEGSSSTRISCKPCYFWHAKYSSSAQIWRCKV